MPEQKKERYEGVFNGRKIRFNRKFRSHRLTDDECEALLRGEEIEVKDLVSQSSGKIYGVKAKLDELEGTDKETGEIFKYFGVAQTEFLNIVPRSFCQHEFTDDEYTMLEAGRSVHVDGFVSKSGRSFNATVHYGVDQETGRYKFIFD